MLPDDLGRTHDEKLKALVLAPDFPVAVRDLATLEQHIGEWAEIPGFSPHEAVRLTSISNPVFSDYMDCYSHIWVSPTLRRYRSAWRAAGFKVPIRGSRQLDHLHAKHVALRQGYGYVVLVDVSSGPNMSAGHAERRFARSVEPESAVDHPVFYAQEIHWAKMWDLNQLKPDELTKETLGRSR